MARDARRIRVSTAEREQALVRLAEALTDGRLEAAEYLVAEERLRQAVTYADIDAVVDTLDAKASLVERHQAIASIDAAVADGLLDPAERHGRVEAASNATTDAQLAALVADLTASTGSSARVSNADREAVAARLREAVEEGRLDLAQFDERASAAYAARLSSELARLVADLPEPAAPPAPQSPAPQIEEAPRPPAPRPPEPPVEKPRREWKPGAGYWLVQYGLVGILVAVGFSVGMSEEGIGFVLWFPPAAFLVIIVVLVVRSRRRVAADPVAEPASQVEDSDAEDLTGAMEELTGVVKGLTESLEQAAGPFEQLMELPGHKRTVTALACLVLPDGTPVAISGAQDNTAMVWDLANYTLSHTLSGHTNDVVGVAAIVLPDGVPVAVTASADRTVRVWDLRDGSQRSTLLGLTGEPRSVACFTLPNGNPAAICLSSDRIRMWDLRDLSVLRDFEADFTFEAVVPMELPGSEPVVVVRPYSIDYVLHVIGLENGDGRPGLRGHTDSLTAIDVTVLPDGTPVAVSASLDKTIRVWDLRQGTLLHTIAGMIFARQDIVCTSLPDGTPVVVGAAFEDNTCIWNLRDGTEMGTIGLQGVPIASVALPEQTFIVSTTFDDSVVAVHTLTDRRAQ